MGRNRKIIKPRNPYAFDPIMKKGGPHQKSNKANRKSEKQKFKNELKDRE